MRLRLCRYNALLQSRLCRLENVGYFQGTSCIWGYSCSTDSLKSNRASCLDRTTGIAWWEALVSCCYCRLAHWNRTLVGRQQRTIWVVNFFFFTSRFERVVPQALQVLSCWSDFIYSCLWKLAWVLIHFANWTRFNINFLLACLAKKRFRFILLIFASVALVLLSFPLCNASTVLSILPCET